jgi:hypothetical protein
MLTKREEIITLMQSEIDKTDPREYFQEALGFIPVNYKSISWCGLICLAVLRRAKVTDWTWRVGLGFLYKLPITKDPQTGDIAYFLKFSHHAMVEEVRDDGIFIIAGNTPNVSRSFITKDKVHAFYSIEPLLVAAAKQEEK